MKQLSLYIIVLSSLCYSLSPEIYSSQLKPGYIPGNRSCTDSWINDGYCDASNNTEECQYDGGDCCPGDCASDNEFTSYDCSGYGGDCDTCIDPDSSDLIEGGQCYEENDEIECDYTQYQATCDGGSYAYEVYWFILDSNGIEIYEGGAPFDEPVCLLDGIYTLEMTDSYGDGWNGNIFTLTDSNNNIVFQSTLEQGNSESINFILGDVEISGCIDENANNYNPDADIDDGNCSYNPIDYQTQIQPIFNQNCTNCHGQSAGLNLSSYNQLMAGDSQNGPVVHAFNSQESILIQKLGEDPPFGAQMPRNAEPLSSNEINLISAWIDQGAVESLNLCEDYTSCNYGENADCLYPEANYDCDGYCAVEIDCNGLCGGNAVLDECGDCNGSGIPVDQCDCDGNNEDECGVCNGNGASTECWDASIVCSYIDCPNTPNSGNHYSINDSGNSSNVLLDVIVPTITIIYPNGGEELDSGETITLQIDYIEDNLSNTSISVLASTALGQEYEIIGSNLSINDISVTLPDVNTNAASLKIIISDIMGNTSFDISDNSFTIGNPDENSPDIEHYTINDSGNSSAIILDVIPPIISFTYPNGGEEFDPGESLSPAFEYVEDHLTDTPISIYISNEIASDYEALLEDVSFDNLDITLPDINSSSATLKVIIVDIMGNSSDDITDNSFTIGTPGEESFIFHYSINDKGQSSLSILDVIPPELSIQYPNGGEHIDNYSDCNVSCPASDDHLSDTGLSIEVSFALGGWFVETASDINPYYSSDYPVDLSADGEIPESIYGLMRATVTDQFGNTKTDMSNGYFILGDPQGDININYINEEERTVLVDWSWIENQVIAITEEALTTVTELDYIKIYDESGVNTDYCDEDNPGSTGMVELAHIDISEETGSKIVNLPCGFDYCEQGGSRIIGYAPGSSIKFTGGVNGLDDQYDLTPASSQLIEGEMTFDNSTQVITEFSFGNRINIHTNTVSIDEREIDNFNVYSRVTNHSGGINRNCNNDGVCDEGEALANCFDDCCDVPGSEENEEWCFEENLVGLSTYYANLNNGNYVPNNQGSATINYRIWLLDQNGDEAVVTLDTEGIEYGGDGDLTTVYEQTLGTGWNWFSFNVYVEDMGVNFIFSQFTQPEWQCEYGGSDTNCPYYIKSQDAFGIYYEGYGFYPEFTMNIEEFYKLQMNAPSQLLFQGIIADPAATPIALGSGWNWIGYIPLDPLSVNIGLANIIANNSPYYIKSQSAFGLFYDDFGFYPEFNMESHGGYMLQMNSEDILTYPSEGLFSFNPNEIRTTSNNTHWSFNHKDYEFSASTTLEIDMKHLPVSEDDQIAVFYEDECVGIATADICPINNRMLFSLLYYSNQEEVEGLTLQYYNAANNEIYEVRESIDFVNDANFGDIYSPIVLHDMTMPLEFKLENPYPNPFNPVTTIDFQLADNVDNITLAVYDIKGRLIETIYTGALNYGYHSYTWNADQFASGVYFVNMITKDNRFTKKITLLK